MEIQLKILGINLSIAHTIDDGVAAYDPQKHTLILIDWNLPGGDGTQVAKRIRAKYTDANIVFLSTGYSDERLSAANAFQPVACLKKDTDTANIIAELVQKCLEQERKVI